MIACFSWLLASRGREGQMEEKHGVALSLNVMNRSENTQTDPFSQDFRLEAV
jgi:hypothetical protein